MEALVLTILATACAALPSAGIAQTPAIPLVYNYGGYPRIQANVKWGTKAQQSVPTIFDTGSVGFWVYGPNATINDGSQYHFTQGPCNKSVKDFYNWPASTSHTDVKSNIASFAYGGNGKIVSTYYTVNDTFSFPNTKWPGVKNSQVAISNWTVVAQLDDGCKIPESTFDHSILGMAPYGVGGTIISSIGPSFRYNLWRQGQTKSQSFSMWFDQAPASAEGKYQGTSIFGAVPAKNKWSGELVRVKVNPPKDAYIGYYVSTPQLSATSATRPGKDKIIKNTDTSVKQCLLDSGTGQDRIPFSAEQLNQVTGLITYKQDATEFPAWNGSCDSIPKSAVLKYTFPGATAGKNVTVAVPIRSYARGEYDQLPGFDSKKVCGLSIELDAVSECTFGAPFFTAAFAVFHDQKKQIALAQGGISNGSSDGIQGLGGVTPIEAGQNIPGSV